MEGIEESVALFDKVSQTAIELGMMYGPKLLLAIVVLVVGLSFIKGLTKLMDTGMDKAKVDVTLQRFLLSITNVALKAVLLIVFASMIGVETASLIAMLGAAGLAVGLALQGSLSNFAGGVLILFFKPFKVGDVIEAQGHLGRVEEIQIFNTIVATLDNQKVIIPNAALSNGCVKNIFAYPERRIDQTWGISYSDDVVKARQVLQAIFDKESRLLAEKGIEIYVSAHADSSINMLTRVWVKSDDYWPVYFEILEQVKLAFDENKITIPFPQRDVHLFQQQA